MKIKVNKDFLEKIRESLCKMLIYVEDELLDRYNEDNIIYKDVENANKLLEDLYELIDKEGDK